MSEKISVIDRATEECQIRFPHRKDFCKFLSEKMMEMAASHRAEIAELKKAHRKRVLGLQKNNIIK